ncbi:hypothetical protein R6Q59_002272 [Mikania micrantha]
MDYLKFNFKLSDYHVKFDEARQCLPNSLQYLNWKFYPHWCLPNTFEANNLVTLEMSHGKIERLWKQERVMKKLKFLFLGYIKLKSLDLGLMPNLQRLNLESCYDLINLYVLGGCLESLVYLNLSCCKSSKLFSFIKHLESLEVLYLDGLNLNEFSNSMITGKTNNCLLELHL